MEIHFNYWRLANAGSGKGVASDFFEVGVLLKKNASLLEKLCIYLPVKVDRKAISDCGPRFFSPDIAQGIFNEPLSCKQNVSPKNIDLLDGAKLFCRVHTFVSDSEGIDSDELGSGLID